MTKNMLEDSVGSEALAARHPFKGIGNVEDIAKTVLFLVSDDASWITGTSLCVDGGYTTM